MISEIHDFKYYGHGFSLTAHGRFGEKGVLTVIARSLDAKEERKIQYSFSLANAIFPFLHTKYIELSGWNPAGAFAKLSEREKECLRWAAEGKSSWETSMILNISERTVNHHIHNAKIKLSATNRVQAVAKAVLYQLL